MSKRFRVFLIHLLILVFACGMSFSAIENKEYPRISKEKIEETKKKKEFDYYKSYAHKKEGSTPDFKPNIAFNPGGFWSKFSEILPYIFVGIFIFVLLFILYNLFSERGFDKRIKYVDKKKEDISIVDEIDEEYIETNDFDALIQRAKTNENYRLALRLMFLKALQLLDNKNLIRYKKNKTNFDYSFEIQNAPLKTQFLQTSDVFAWVWYGRESLDFDTYQQLEKDFTTLIQQVES